MITIHRNPNPLLQNRVGSVHCQTDRNSQQDQCVVNECQWDDSAYHDE